MNRVTRIDMEDVVLKDAGFTVRWEPSPEGGVEILGVTLGALDVTDLLSELTLETIAQEVQHGDL